MASAHAVANGGGEGQAFANPGETAYAFSSALPDRAYAENLIDGAGADALLGPRDVVMGTGVLGANLPPTPLPPAGEGSRPSSLKLVSFI